MKKLISMSLARFSIIVAIDASNGIAKNGEIPWNSKEDMRHFRNFTVGRGKNVIIMGRKTFEGDLNGEPLEKRTCVVISRTMKQEDYPDIMVYPSVPDALAGIGATMSLYEDVFIIGGETIYREILENYLYLCDQVIVTRFKNDFKCDQHFDYGRVQDFPLIMDVCKSRDYNRYHHKVKISHDESLYIDALRDILDHGETKPDRTGIGTRSLFGSISMRFDIRDRLPIITTKKTNYEMIIKELLFFISGKTDTNILAEQNVKIWSGNTSREFLQKQSLPYVPGDMGPMYGFQWRHCGETYQGCDETYQGFDQLSELIKNIRSDPHSRRHVLCNWNTMQIPEMVLAPCHVIAQFNVSGDRRFLDCEMYQRSGDMFLGVPFNITSYCLLTYMIAHICGMRPRYYTHVIGDAHIYNNHIEQASKLIKRIPRPFPKLSFRSASRLQEIDDFIFDSFVIQDYTSWPALNGEMAI